MITNPKFDGNVEYILFEDVKMFHEEEEYKRFILFMSGQTTPIVMNNGDLINGIFYDDYKRWIREGKKSSSRY